MAEERKACAECPFSRRCEPGATGGGDPAVFVGQAFGPFVLACHMPPDYWKDKRDPTHLQCAGAAIFRANVGRDEMMPKDFVRVPADKEDVFADGAELIAHHKKIPIEEARAFLIDLGSRALLSIEMSKVDEITFYKPGEVKDGKKGK